MSLSVFQAVITLNSVAEPVFGSGNYAIDFDLLDREGLFLGYNVQVGDAIILDTSDIDPGTLTRYTITSIAASGVYNVVANMSIDLSNGGIPPDLSSYDLLTKGLITRKSSNYKLLNLPSLQIQGLSDKFAFYLINYMNNDIVDNISGGSSSPDQVLTNLTPTPTTIGGIAAGTTFSNTPVETVLQNLLYPYQPPTFSSFTIASQISLLEVGATVAGGSRTFNWSSTNSANVLPASITIQDITVPTILAIDQLDDGSEPILLSQLTKTSAQTHTWRISATNTNSATFTRDYTITWQWRRYYGEQLAEDVSEIEVKALRGSSLSTTFSGTYPFVASGYKYISYPSLFGTATSFKDQSTNLDVPFQTVQVISITNTNGVTTNYNVHRTTNVIGSAMNIVVS